MNEMIRDFGLIIGGILIGLLMSYLYNNIIWGRYIGK